MIFSQTAHSQVSAWFKAVDCRKKNTYTAHFSLVLYLQVIYLFKCCQKFICFGIKVSSIDKTVEKRQEMCENVKEGRHTACGAGKESNTQPLWCRLQPLYLAATSCCEKWNWCGSAKKPPYVLCPLEACCRKTKDFIKYGRTPLSRPSFPGAKEWSWLVAGAMLEMTWT